MLPHQSPQEVTFWLLHVVIDMFWRQWQGKGQSRMYDYYGNRGDADEYTGPFHAQLTDKLRYFNLIPDVTVRDVMDPQGDVLCYRVSGQSWQRCHKVACASDC